MPSDFDLKLNISYVEDDAIVTNKIIIKHCFCSYIVYFLIYLLLEYNPFFNDYSIDFLRHIYLGAFFIYIFLAPLIYFIFRPKTLCKSHNVEFCNYFLNIFKKIFRKDTVFKCDYSEIIKSFIPEYSQKQALMLVFIKVFFGSLMIYFAYNDVGSIREVFIKYRDIVNNHDKVGFWNFIIYNREFLYSAILKILFFIDVIVFSIGYLTETSLLKNKIRTVDTNIVGVLFCLMCYPPFNNATSDFLGWNQDDYAMLYDNSLSLAGWILRLVGIFFVFIYVSASVALGTKASNLTNRGTVSRFPYNIVRHPAYISKLLFWLVTTIPFLAPALNADDFNMWDYIVKSILIIISYCFWFIIYYFRAITEERHLMQDPQYREYAKKVRWRFIPKVF